MHSENQKGDGVHYIQVSTLQVKYREKSLKNCPVTEIYRVSAIYRAVTNTLTL